MQQDKEPHSPHRLTFILGFVLLLGPPIIAKAGHASGSFELPYDLALVLTLFVKVGLIVLTTWYSRKLRLGWVSSVLLGLATLLMCMAWLIPIYLIQRRPEPQPNATHPRAPSQSVSEKAEQRDLSPNEPRDDLAPTEPEAEPTVPPAEPPS